VAKSVENKEQKQRIVVFDWGAIYRRPNQMLDR